MITLGMIITRDFTTHNPNTGDVQDADFLPTCEVFANAVDIPIILPIVVKRAGFIGIYRVTFTVNSVNGFMLNGSYNVDVEATVNAITARANIYSFMVEQAAKQKAVFAI